MSVVMEEKTSRGLREIAVLGIFALGVFFLVSLFTFNKADVGWTQSSSIGQKITNACGLSGAWLADFSFSFFGLCAYLFPIMVFWHGYQFYALARQKQHKLTTLLQWLGSFATVVASAALVYLYVLRVGVDLPGGTGGILGQEIGDAVLLLFGNSGATMFLIVLLLSGITLATEVSWLNLIDSIGKYTFNLFNIITFNSAKEDEDYQYESSEQSEINTLEPESKSKSVKGNSLLKTPDGFMASDDTEPATATAFQEMTAQQSPKADVPKYKKGEDVLPTLSLLDERDTRVIGYSKVELEAMSRLVENILADFGVAVVVVNFLPGPVITSSGVAL